MSREECARCGRPVVVCYCAHVRPIATRTRVLVLQHPREAVRAIGTARIAKLCLPECELAVGVALEHHPLVHAALADPEREPIVLYPSRRARPLAERTSTRPATLIALDGTWAHARALARENPWLERLPHYALTPTRPSEYRIRREPLPEFVSTVEALAEALALLEGRAESFEALREPFRAMVAMQVEFAERTPNARRRRRPRREPHAPRLPSAFETGSLVCLHAEANAWPHDRALRRPPYPHELVQLVLARTERARSETAGESESARSDTDGSASLELLVRPRVPLASSPIVHARIPRERLLDGVSLDEFLARSAAFLRADDVLCTWGSYTLELVEREGLALPAARIDLRKVTGDLLGRRPGTLEQTVAQLGLEPRSLGEGRGGERAGMLLALARHYTERARSRTTIAFSEAAGSTRD